MKTIIPRLILHQEATSLLCRERSGSEDEAEPLTSRHYIDMGFDDASCSSSDSDVSSVSNDDSSNSSLSLDIDIEAQVDIAPQISPLGIAARSNESLFYANDEVHAFGKTKSVVGSTVAGAQTVAKKTIKGAEKVARNTVKTTGKVAKQTGKTTRKVAKKTGKVAKKTARETEKAVKKTANAAVGLPHELSAHWPNLTGILAGQILIPVAMSVVAALTMFHSVDEGLSQNRSFVYGTHTLMDLFMIAPFISTCHYAIPDAKIPLKARMYTVLLGLGVAKLVLATISEAWWSKDTVFPVPFSFIVTMFFAVPSSLIALWFMAPMRNDPVIGDKIRTKFWLCFGLLGSYVLSLVVACLWAVMFRQLSDRPFIQFVWNIFYQVLEFILKIVVAANLTTRLNPKRWLQLNMVIDMIFGCVQIAMLPFFANWQTVCFSVLAMMGTVAWRAYAGVDRLLEFLAKSPEVLKSSDGAAATLKGIRGLAAQVTISPVKDIKPISIRLDGYGAGRHLGEAYENDIEMQSIEISATDESQSTSDNDENQSTSDSDESQSTSDVESTEAQPVNGEGAVSTTGKEAEPKIDRRAQFRNLKSRPVRNSVLREVSGEQRHLYHIVDSVSSAVVVTVVRLAFLITSAALRSPLIAHDHINASFQIPEEQWMPIVGYAIVFVFGIIAVIAAVGVYIRYVARLGGLNLSRVIAFVFRDSCWFLFFWFMYIQFTNIGLQLNHYGADFSLKFEWIGCPEGTMDWPECMKVGL